MISSQAVRAFLALVAPRNTVVASRVLLAVSDPDEYKKRFAARREARFQDEDDDVDVWLEMVDALEQAKLSCGVDWKSSAADIHWNLERVLATKKLDAKKLFAFYDEDAHLKTKTLDFIEACGAAFSGHGVALVELDISSDSYELTVVPYADLPRVQSAAKPLGGKVVLRGPKKPLAEPLAAAPKKGPVGRFEAKKLASVWGDGFATTNGVVRYENKATVLHDCRTWPPKQVKIPHPKVRVVLDGDRAIVSRVHHPYRDGAFQAKAEGVLEVRDGRTKHDLLAKLPDRFDLHGAGFVGDLVVFLPTDSTVRAKDADAPLVWNGKKLEAAKGLPKPKPAKGTRKDPWPSFLEQGFARTGSGIDLLVWEGQGFVAKGGKLAKVCAIKDVATNDVFHGVPANGDAFYYVARTPTRTSEIREVRLGEPERSRARIERLLETPVLGPGGVLVMGSNRSGEPKAPVLVLFHPETNDFTEIAPEVFGVRRDDFAKAYGTGGKPGAEYLWLLDGYVLKRLPWSSVLALPRRR